MAGTFLLDQLTQLAASRSAIVRLLGDDRQLPAVESGGALRLIASQPGTPELSVLYRFRNPNEAATTLKLRVGDSAAVDWYAANNRIRAGSREAMTQSAYAGWRSDMLAGKVTLMAAATNATVTELPAPTASRPGRSSSPESNSTTGTSPGKATGSSLATTTAERGQSAAGTVSRTATPGSSSAGTRTGR